MSIGPWNTGTGGAAACEDMPRKSIDIKLSEYPVQQKREHCTLFLPSGEDGSGQSPGLSQRTDSLRVRTAILWALGEPFGSYICNFQGSFEPIFMAYFFIDYLTLPIIIQLNLQFYKKPYYSLSDQVSVNIYSISMDYSSF